MKIRRRTVGGTSSEWIIETEVIGLDASIWPAEFGRVDGMSLA
jgi:hypothetical protein